MDKVIQKEQNRCFENMQGAMLDILEAIELEYNLQFVSSLRSRVEKSKTKEELRLIMDGMLVLSGFANPQA